MSLVSYIASKIQKCQSQKGKRQGKKLGEVLEVKGDGGGSIQVLDLMNQFIKIVPEAQG